MTTRIVQLLCYASFFTITLCPANEHKTSEHKTSEHSSSAKTGEQRVLSALVEYAKSTNKSTGDSLFLEYLQTGASAALKLDNAQDPVGSYLLALGYFFDPSCDFDKNTRLQLTRTPFAQNAETMQLLGAPSLQGRNDLALHFALSAGYCERFGPQWTQSLGILKESMDTRPGGTGFSFIDLAADYAGVDFALRLKAGHLQLSDLAQVNSKDLLPQLDDFEEGIYPEDLSKFQVRLQQELIRIQTRIQQMNQD
jgi:hypothetical protein